MYNAIYDTLIIGKKVVYLPSCHSTNDIAAELVLKGLAEEGTVVITDNQVRGRGQRGSQWHAEPAKNLTFSIILRPHFISIQEQFLISQMAAVAIYNYLSDCVSEVKIKWPNDIFIDRKKVSGTLIENTIQGSFLTYSIVGIGININQTEFVNPRSASLAVVAGHPFSLQSEFNTLIHFLDAAYVRLKSMNGRDAIRSEYGNNLLGYNTWMTFKNKDGVIKGMVTGVTDTGKLCVQMAGSDQVQEFDLKEVEWVWSL